MKATVPGIMPEKRSAQTFDHHRHWESANLRVDLVWQMRHFRVSLISDYLPSTQCGGIYQNQFSPGYGGSVSSIVRDHSCHKTLSLPVILTTRMPSSPKCLNTSAFFSSVVYALAIGFINNAVIGWYRPILK